MLFNQANRPERAIEVLETQLRSGGHWGRMGLVVLEVAYRLAGRPRDALRARTSDPANAAASAAVN